MKEGEAYIVTPKGQNVDWKFIPVKNVTWSHKLQKWITIEECKGKPIEKFKGK